MQNGNHIGLYAAAFLLALCTALPACAGARDSSATDDTLRAAIEEQLGKEKKVFYPVIADMLAEGADTAFVLNLVRDPRVRHDKKYARINVTGYLKKADYSTHYSTASVNRSLPFLSEHDSVLQQCENKYEVPKEVVTAILWIETRHGGYLGTHHVATVYLCLALADQPEYIAINKRALRQSFKGDSTELAALEKKIETRSETKALWALEQLMALEQMAEHSPVPVEELYGSYAGAFGIAQFIPSSYVKWAADGNADGKTDLFDPHDAIFSVGRYLKTNGWGPDESDQRAAVYHYNRSSAYVDAVVLLAEKLRERSRQEPAE